MLQLSYANAVVFVMRRDGVIRDGSSRGRDRFRRCVFSPRCGGSFAPDAEPHSPSADHIVHRGRRFVSLDLNDGQGESDGVRARNPRMRA